MKDIAVPPLVPVTTEGNLSDLPARNGLERPGHAAFARREGTRWVDVTNAQFLAEVRALAKGLVAAGVAVGDRVALMSKTRYEWTLADFAIWSAGAVAVPIYETSSAEQVSWILGDSGCVAVIVETPTHARTLAEVRDDLPGLRDVWQIDAGGLDDLVTAGADTTDAELDERRARVRRGDIATIIYTSGTTGRPKGCELTHDNFMALADNTVERLGDVVSAKGASTLLFLPLAHVFARFIEVLCVQSGARMGHTADIKNLLDDLGSYSRRSSSRCPGCSRRSTTPPSRRPTPRAGARSSRWPRSTAIDWSRRLGRRAAPARCCASSTPSSSELVYTKLRGAMGGKVQYAVSGGGPLGVRLGHFYRGIGLTVLEGYGLTETTAPATVNTPAADQDRHGRPAAAGRRDPDRRRRRGADQGPARLRRLLEQPGRPPREAMVDGWFRTGDLGELDDDGFLWITGRKKEILVTAGGKNVAPAVLEDRLRAHPLVSQCIVVGDQKPFIAALVTLDAEMLPTWLANNGLERPWTSTRPRDPRGQSAPRSRPPSTTPTRRSARPSPSASSASWRSTSPRTPATSPRR